jgi:1-aminocyclopropane-1-carboxylate deaminase/D-cysteine desulfhydrase-like pyridoxal-dependent ACC family enzyme
MHGTPPAGAQGNLLLDRLLGVAIRFTGDPDRSVVDQEIQAAAAELRASGRRPYVVPRGGASARGALGYLACVPEINAQCQSLRLELDWLVLATGSCGTQSGLLAGAKIHGLRGRVLGITVSRPASECVERIGRLAVEAAALAGHSVALAPGEIHVRDGLIGAGYGVPSAEGTAAMRLAARTEGLFLDPTYTGKGLAGLIAEIRAGRIGPDATVLFLHTGGEPGIFAHPEALLAA